MQLQLRADEDERKQAGGGVKTKRILAAAATGCLRQHDAAHTKLRKTSGQSRGEEKARSLASRRRVAVGVRYVGAGVDEVMHNGVGGDVGARCVRTNTNGRQMMCDCIQGIRIELIKVEWRKKLHNGVWDTEPAVRCSSRSRITAAACGSRAQTCTRLQAARAPTVGRRNSRGIGHCQRMQATGRAHSCR